MPAVGRRPVMVVNDVDVSRAEVGPTDGRTCEMAGSKVLSTKSFAAQEASPSRAISETFEIIWQPISPYKSIYVQTEDYV